MLRRKNATAMIGFVGLEGRGRTWLRSRRCSPTGVWLTGQGLSGTEIMDQVMTLFLGSLLVFGLALTCLVTCSVTAYARSLLICCMPLVSD